MNIIYIAKAIFQKSWDLKDKYKNESVIITILLFIAIVGWVIGYHIYQFYNLQNTVESMRDAEFLGWPYTKEEFILKIRDKYPQYNEVSDLDLYNGFIEKYPKYESQIISE